MGDEQPVGAGDWPPVANGSKVGGWAFWWQTSPFGLECPACGADRRLLLVLHTEEGALNVFACTQDVRHPIKPHVD